MRISSKIILLAAILLGFLGGNAFISWQQIKKVQREFNEVVTNDLKLMEATTSLNDLQLKKEILFEKLTSSAEELAFGNTNESRRQYLLDYVKDLQEQFKEDGRLVNEEINQALAVPDFSESLAPMFRNVKKALSFYDQKVESIFIAVSATGYQLSMEDLDQVETQQVDLAKELKKVLTEVSVKVEASVEAINAIQKRSERVLWVMLSLSFMVALILSSTIIHRIHTALKALVSGVRELHQGKVGSQVLVKTSDEIGEVAKAFNHMSKQLKAYQEDMQKKNVELASSLTITREQKKDLEISNRDLDRFVHLIGHDIKGPITAMIFYADYLKKHKEGLDVKSQQAAEKLSQVSLRLSTMVSDLLEMTRITRTRRPFENFNSSDIIQEALQRQEFLIQKTSATVSLQMNFPSILGDRLKLAVVFYNLIGNAIKYSAQGENKPQVDISWQKRPGDFMFSIKDNGIGIAKEHFQDIFDVFKRLPEAESFEGSGVGLAIVKDIIHEHGGQIWVESTPGCGTQFFFTIPLESSSRLS